ncbi:hypothetical protein CL630_02315 [bacterium]|nr:hypothetical protein [bacterium]
MMAGVTLVAFAIYLLYQEIPLNISTWGLWTILNTVNCVTMMRAGNKQAWLPAGYATGAFLITVMVIKNGTWSWGVLETLVLLGTLGALYVSFKVNKELGIVMAVSAMLIAGAPTVYDSWLAPASESWWLWAICCISSVISAVVASGWTIKDRLFSVTGGLFNALMFLLVVF